MNRRDSVLALLVLGTSPFPARAQLADKMYRIGFLSLALPRERFVQIIAALRELGYEDGRNIVFDYGLAEGKDDRLPILIADLVAKKPNLIVAPLNPEILEAKRATSAIPIVMVFGWAPVETGLVASLARPGGNLTGTAVQGPETAGKNLELLRDAVPRAIHITILWEPEFPGAKLYMREVERAAKAMGMQLTMLPGRTPAELETAFDLTARNRPDGLLVVLTGAIFTHRERVVEFAARQRLAAIYTHKLAVSEGGLMSYSADLGALVRRTAGIIDRILRGANPAELPVEQPTKFELVINRRTAKTLGLVIPQSVLLRADEVIE